MKIITTATGQKFVEVGRDRYLGLDAVQGVSTTDDGKTVLIIDRESRSIDVHVADVIALDPGRFVMLTLGSNDAPELGTRPVALAISSIIGFTQIGNQVLVLTRAMPVPMPVTESFAEVQQRLMARPPVAAAA